MTDNTAERTITFGELVQTVGWIAPLLEDKIEHVLQEHSELTSPDGSLMLGKLVGISLLDFIGFAFDRPELGYKSREARGDIEEPIGRVGTVGIDVSDLDRAAVFWGTLLGTRPGEPRGHFLDVGQFAPGTSLLLQQVPEGEGEKNKVYLYIDVADLDKAVANVLALGGQKRENNEEDSGSFAVMTDPDGNEFCLSGEST